jgi:hypothetical protein
MVRQRLEQLPDVFNDLGERAAGAEVDDLVRPTLGPTGAIVAGFGSAFAVLVGLGVVCYRGLTR